MVTTPPSLAQAELLRALDHHRAGRTAEAAEIYRRLIAEDPQNADALHLLGMMTAQDGNPQEGEQLISAALKIKDDVPLFWSNHGNVLGLLGRPSEAIESYDRAVQLAPDFVEAIYNLGGNLITAGRVQEALEKLDKALAGLAPDVPGRHIVLTGRGNALLALERNEEALAVYDAVIAIAPRNVDAISNRGIVLKQLDRHAEAIAAFDQALAIVPGHLDSILGKAHAQILGGDVEAPLAILDRVLKVQPDNALARYIRGHALMAKFKTAEALTDFQRAAELKPELVEAVYNAADALRGLGRRSEAIAMYQRVLDQVPDHAHALSGMASAASYCCDWPTQARIRLLLEEKVRQGSRGMLPFALLSEPVTKELQLQCARNFARHRCPEPAVRLTSPHARSNGGKSGVRIKLGYISSDIRLHAMAYQMAELFEVHDRSRFEVIGFSAGPDDRSAVRQRISKAFDEFHDVAPLKNEEIARLIHKTGIDVAIDLNGHTMYSRIGALAWRPAPVQATYLGFPGTSGATFMDYVIADATVAPMSEQPYFTEQIVHLPGCYQVSDRARKVANQVPSKAVYGLPQNGFVFACFNTSYKISPEIFDVWMRILKSIPGSVLWLVGGDKVTEGNLRREAQVRGVDPTRLVFCGVVEPEQHLARHALADLFLDTLPYNSHGTGSFALWAGLPILTCIGETFAGRVAASMLRAIGLPELVVPTLAEYEALAVKLARELDTLGTLRARLAANRTTAPLFDTDLFRRHIEAAYETMHERALRGEPPRSFAVPPVK